MKEMMMVRLRRRKAPKSGAHSAADFQYNAADFGRRMVVGRLGVAVVIVAQEFWGRSGHV